LEPRFHFKETNFLLPLNFKEFNKTNLLPSGLFLTFKERKVGKKGFYPGLWKGLKAFKVWEVINYPNFGRL